MKILHILNSDFGARHTMGIRSYHIFKKSSKEVSVVCRKNVSEIKENVFEPSIIFYFLSRGIQMLRMLWKPFEKLKRIESFIFNSFCKKQILKNDVIHFFYRSEILFDYAISKNKYIIIEGFTHPKEIKNLELNGMQLDDLNFKIDHNELNCYEKSDLIISPSKWVSQTLKLNNLHNKVNEVLYGVDKNVKDFHYVEQEKIKICFAGGIKRTKGILNLLEAWRDLPDSIHDQLELHLYGRMYNEIKAEFNKLKRENVFYHGFENNIQNIYLDKQIYVFPSYFEGCSKTVLEALSFGLTVITTFNSGSPIENDKNGIIVEVGSSESIAKALLRLIENKELLKKLSIAGYQLSRKLSWSEYSKNVNNLYVDCLK
ncbi:MAG: hypothetical protein COA79_00265 [Planctomycetota bacterium]|nr:MAG: hypothetical protein COA79_00265 [Planctomycetota bacterium]